MLSEALSELQERTLVNYITGQIKWPEIIRAINDAGTSDAVLAKRLGESRSTIHRWHNGTQPGSFQTACQVMMMYHESRKRIGNGV